MVTAAARAVETIAAAAAQPGIDWQGWAQTAAQILVPLAAVLYIELRTLPRLQRQLAVENTARDEELQRRLGAENAEQARRLHEETLEHSARVARQARYGQALLELRDLVQQARAELWSILSETGLGSAAPWRGMRRLQFLLEATRTDAVYLDQAGSVHPSGTSPDVSPDFESGL
jgi:hypothetical protein